MSQAGSERKKVKRRIAVEPWSRFSGDRFPHCYQHPAGAEIAHGAEFCRIIDPRMAKFM